MNPAASQLWITRLETYSALWSGNVWRACWQGGAFILLAWLACRWLPTLSARVRHWFWLLACLKLVVGLLWAAPLSLPAPIRRVAPAFLASVETPSTHAPVLIGTGRDGSQIPAAFSFPAASPILSPRSLLLSLWLIGVLTGAILTTVQARKLSALCRRARSLDSGPMGAQARELGVLMGLSRPPRVAESEDVAAPLVIGPLRPVVLLPPGFESRFSASETRLALAHELAHVRGCDLWLAFVPALAQMLFFFFPPVWFACREWSAARESACDREALLVTGASSALYGRLLLKLASEDSAPPIGQWRGAMGATASYHTLKRRLLWIKERDRSRSKQKSILLALLLVPGAFLLAPWRIQAASVPGTAPFSATMSGAARLRADPARVPAQELYAQNDPRKRYLLIGVRPDNSPPPDGYHLLVVLPGGAGDADFQYFVKRMQAWGLPPGYLIAELIAPHWTKTQMQNLVWPTRTNTLPGVGFPTETFVEDVIGDVKARYPIHAQHVYTLGWASGGPACYAAALQPSTQTRGAFIAMSVFLPASLPPLKQAQGRRFYLQQPLDTPFAPLEMAAQARDRLRASHADAQLATVEGGYGWHGRVYEQIRRGIDWLEQP